jgi:hypothetical protein
MLNSYALRPPPSHVFIGLAASGLDLIPALLDRLQDDQRGTANTYPIENVLLYRPAIRPENLRALELLDAFLAEPDDVGDAWWADFEQDLQEHRFNIPEIR